MCYGTALRSKYPRARVLSIDTTAAKALPGVIDVFTAADIPGENKDRPFEARSVYNDPGRRIDALSGRCCTLWRRRMETAEAKKLIKQG
ncbi:MAG: hypothetical protein ACLTDC_06750 [Lachnospiraceae bacterium]